MKNIYFAFCDPAGGSGSDSMTLAVAHEDAGKIVVDGVWEQRPPFSPEAVVGEFAQTLQRYGISRITGDRYAGGWPAERFRVHGLTYQPSEFTKSEIFERFLVLLNSGRVLLPNQKRLLQQIRGLERRTGRTARPVVDHVAGGHDDLANSVAGACVLVASRPKPRKPWVVYIPLRGQSKLEPGPITPWNCGPERWWRKLN